MTHQINFFRQNQISLYYFRGFSDRRSFYLSNGSKVEAEMMERTSYEFVVSEPFQLKELTNDLKYKAISIPYEVHLYVTYCTIETTDIIYE